MIGDCISMCDRDGSCLSRDLLAGLDTCVLGVRVLMQQVMTVHEHVSLAFTAVCTIAGLSLPPHVLPFINFVVCIPISSSIHSLPHSPPHSVLPSTLPLFSCLLTLSFFSCLPTLPLFCCLPYTALVRTKAFSQCLHGRTPSSSQPLPYPCFYTSLSFTHPSCR